jgi:hypothetical protein
VGRDLGRLVGLTPQSTSVITSYGCRLLVILDVSWGGPFTVESLSPHRTLSANGDMTGTERAASLEPATVTYEQTIIDHLRKSGVSNGQRTERLEFESLVPYPDQWMTSRPFAAPSTGKIAVKVINDCRQRSAVSCGTIGSASDASWT